MREQYGAVPGVGGTMPVAVAISIGEALVRSSAGRHEAAWLGGVAAGWRQRSGPLAVMAEADLTRWAEDSAVLHLQTTEGRLSVLLEGHLGGDGDAFRFTVAGGPAATLGSTRLNGRVYTTSLQGGRLVVGADGLVLAKRTGGEHWTVGVRVGGFANRYGLDLDIGARTGWLF